MHISWRENLLNQKNIRITGNTGGKTCCDCLKCKVACCLQTYTVVIFCRRAYIYAETIDICMYAHLIMYVGAAPSQRQTTGNRCNLNYLLAACSAADQNANSNDSFVSIIHRYKYIHINARVWRRSGAQAIIAALELIKWGMGIGISVTYKSMCLCWLKLCAQVTVATPCSANIVKGVFWLRNLKKSFVFCTYYFSINL